MLNMAGAQIARYLGAEFEGHGGLSDAKVPGHEAGVQKVSSAIMNATSYGNGYIAAGLLGVDEVFSPIQMILDNEITGALIKTSKGFEVDEESLGLDIIDEIGSGGNFLATDHTAMNFRDSLWFTDIWSREMYSVWNESGKKSEIDRAKDKYFNLMNNSKPIEPQISDIAEKKLLNIIKNTLN